MKYLTLGFLLLIVLSAAGQQSDTVSVENLEKEYNYNTLNTLNSAESHFLRGQYYEAKPYYNEVAPVLNDAYIFFKKGRCEQETADYKQAIVSYTKSLSLITFEKSAYTKAWNNAWKSAPARFNLKESLSGIDVIANNDELKETLVVSMVHTKSDLYIYRTMCKLHLEDYYGALKDMRLYHKLINDSNQVSNYMFGLALFKSGKYELAKKYLSAAITLYNTKGRWVSDEIIYKECYYLRGLSAAQLGQKEKACNDISKAGELGHPDAYAAINEYCQ